MARDIHKTSPGKRYLIRKGSVLILALVLASILLSVGMGISGIAMKEIKLTTIGNESGKAFYMADTGAECALYWDSRSTTTVDQFDGGRINDSARYVFATSSIAGFYPLPDVSNLRCYSGFDITGGTDVGQDEWIVEDDIDRATTTFKLKDSGGDDTKPCAIVQVNKRDTGGGVFATTIDSRGQSSCDSNPRRVERGLKVSY